MPPQLPREISSTSNYQQLAEALSERIKERERFRLLCGGVFKQFLATLQRDLDCPEGPEDALKCYGLTTRELRSIDEAEDLTEIQKGRAVLAFNLIVMGSKDDQRIAQWQVGMAIERQRGGMFVFSLPQLNVQKPIDPTDPAMDELSPMVIEAMLRKHKDHLGEDEEGGFFRILQQQEEEDDDYQDDDDE